MNEEGMVERVARAICVAFGDRCPASRYSDHLNAARAALEEMRRPTGEMLAQGAAIMACADMTMTQTGERREMDEWFESEAELFAAFELGYGAAIGAALRS